MSKERCAKLNLAGECSVKLLQQDELQMAHIRQAAASKPPPRWSHSGPNAPNYCTPQHSGNRWVVAHSNLASDLCARERCTYPILQERALHRPPSSQSLL